MTGKQDLRLFGELMITVYKGIGWDEEVKKVISDPAVRDIRLEGIKSRPVVFFYVSQGFAKNFGFLGILRLLSLLEGIGDPKTRMKNDPGRNLNSNTPQPKQYMCKEHSDSLTTLTVGSLGIRFTPITSRVSSRKTSRRILFVIVTRVTIPLSLGWKIRRTRRI